MRRAAALVPEGTPPAFKPSSPALCFQLHARCGRARASTVHLPHGPVATPVYMPVGTHGVVKGLTSSEVASAPMEFQIILGNTYHLANRPGSELLERMGGLHKYMNWPGNLLTDSGGFQMVSLLELAEITEEGVTFVSPNDGKPMLLRPEDSIAHQNRIGSDIMMALDDVVSSVSDDTERFREATARTTRWLDRCVSAHARPQEQNLFGIVQGGLDVSAGGMRDDSLRDLIARDLPGYAIGGLAGGESKDKFWRVVAHCAAALPEDKPRYLMGVGYPLDLVVCTALGVDMYDCVYPTRTGRFGVAMVPEGELRLRHKRFATDEEPIEPGCPCGTCQRFSRAALNRMLRTEAVGGQLVSQHNLVYLRRLMLRLRAAIIDGSFPAVVVEFMERQFPEGDYPGWAVEALSEAGIVLGGSGGSGGSGGGSGGGAGAPAAKRARQE